MEVKSVDRLDGIRVMLGRTGLAFPKSSRMTFNNESPDQH